MSTGQRSASGQGSKERKGYDNAGLADDERYSLAKDSMNLLRGYGKRSSSDESWETVNQEILAREVGSERFPQPKIAGDISKLSPEDYEEFKNDYGEIENENIAVLPTTEAVERYKNNGELENYVWQDEDTVVINDMAAEVMTDEPRMFYHLDQLDGVPTLPYVTGKEFLMKQIGDGGTVREELGEEREGLENGYLVKSIDSEEAQAFDHLDEVKSFLEENQVGENPVEDREDYIVFRGFSKQSRTSVNVVEEAINGVRYKNALENAEAVSEGIPYERDIFGEILFNIGYKDNLEYLSTECDEDLEKVPKPQLEMTEEIADYFSPQFFTRTDPDTPYPYWKTSEDKYKSPNPVRFSINFEEVSKEDIRHLPDEKQNEILENGSEESNSVVTGVNLDLNQYATFLAEYEERGPKEKTPYRTFNLLRKLTGEKPVSVKKMRNAETRESQRIESFLNPKPDKSKIIGIDEC